MCVELVFTDTHVLAETTRGIDQTFTLQLHVKHTHVCTWKKCSMKRKHTLCVPLPHWAIGQKSRQQVLILFYSHVVLAQSLPAAMQV